jgi:hypothetical protein
MALSNGDGTFAVTNRPLESFAAWAQIPGVKVITGDFNRDGRTDIALTGVTGWSTIPMAFSNGDGTFAVTNRDAGAFPVWAAAPVHGPVSPTTVPMPRAVGRLADDAIRRLQAAGYIVQRIDVPDENCVFGYQVVMTQDPPTGTTLPRLPHGSQTAVIYVNDTLICPS